jgi:hypothetical protein
VIPKIDANDRAALAANVADRTKFAAVNVA